MSKSIIGKEIRRLRTEKGLSMESLSDLSGISLRSIQRIENGKSSPRGYTLTHISKALEIELEHLTQFNSKSSSEEEKLKWLNLSALLIIFMPLANLIFPLLLWLRIRDIDMVKSLGAKIINFQITWILITSITLIVAPFLLLFFNDPIVTPFGSVIFTYLIFWLYNIVRTLLTARSISEKKWENIYPKVLKLL